MSFGRFDTILKSLRRMTFPGTHEAAYRPRIDVSAFGWIALAAALAFVEAFAALIDWQLGLAVALAVIFSVIILTRPVLLLPLAVLTVFIESLVFAGLPVTRLLAPAALIMVLVELLRGGARIRPSAPLVCASLYVAWAVASGAWTLSAPGTQYLLQSLGISLVYFLASASLPRSEDDLRHFLYVVAFGAGLMGTLSVLAFAGMPSPPGIDLLQAGRSQGGVGDPDFFAAIQLVVVPLVLVLASETTKKPLRVALYLSLLPILASIFTSLSRGAFIGVIVLGTLFLVSRPERLFRSRQEKALALVVVALGMIGFFSRPFLRDQVVTRAQSIYAPQNQEDKTGSGRTNIWKAAARTAGEHPILGVGYGSFRYISEELILQTPGVDLEVYGDRSEGDNYAAHQTYLGTAAELGFTGLFLYLAILVSTGLALRRTVKRAALLGAPFVGRVAHALLLGLMTWAVTAAFLSTETARMFWVIVGLSIALPRLLPEPWGGAAADYPARSNAPTS
jgi:putative inorganic carbon (hco3(-)) transporter